MSSSYKADFPMKVGSTDRTGVRVVQTRLNAWDVDNLKVDGSFGPKTKAAVQAFQKSQKLLVDGVVGRQTWTALHSLSPGDMRVEGLRILKVLGWRSRTTEEFKRDIRHFQGMYNLGPWLEVDGVIGPKTYAALVNCRDRKAAGKSDISEHFSAWEFKCKCGGRYDDCDRIWADRELVAGCETLRKKIGRFTPLSVCRCPQHNKKVGGYKRSQHLLGLGIDFEVPELTYSQMAALGIFDALGISSNGKVRHGDFRASRRTYAPTDNFPKASGNTERPYRYNY